MPFHRMANTSMPNTSNVEGMSRLNPYAWLAGTYTGTNHFEKLVVIIQKIEDAHLHSTAGTYSREILPQMS